MTNREMTQGLKVTPTRHVQQVAELIKLLSREEIRQLVQLVPQLKEEALKSQDELVQWIRERMAEYKTATRPLDEEDMFLGDLKAKEYFALPASERERIWNELYARAIETAEEHEATPDADVPAR